MEAAPPEPDPTAAAACATLRDALPDAIEEGERREVSPESPYTAAWADPAIVLTCGVDQPVEYEPTSELVIVNRVDWLVVPNDDGYACYAPGRVAWVRVDVPDRYGPASFALVELSNALDDTVPLLEPTAG